MVASKVRFERSKRRKTSSSPSSSEEKKTRRLPAETTPYGILRRIRERMEQKRITTKDIRRYMQMDSRFEMVDFYHVHRAIRFLGVVADETQSRKLFRLFYTGAKDKISKREYITSDAAMSIFFENPPHDFVCASSPLKRDKKPWEMFENT